MQPARVIKLAGLFKAELEADVGPAIAEEGTLAAGRDRREAQAGRQHIVDLHCRKVGTGGARHA
jgi:hypothetical protein